MADDEVFEVEALLDSKGSKGKRQYLVKWKGYGPSHNTWEPEAEMMIACADFVEELEGKKKKPRQSASKARSPSPVPKKRGRSGARSPSPAADYSNPGEGDIVSLKWAGDVQRSICTLRKDDAGDLIPWPVDGTWSDETLVFDPKKDDWRWVTPADQIKPTSGAASASGGDAADTEAKSTKLRIVIGAGFVAMFAMFLDPATQEWLRGYLSKST